MIAWQKARELTRRVYEITRTREFAKDLRLSGQIQSAAVSIMSTSQKDLKGAAWVSFINFYRRQKPLGAELRSQLYVALDVRYIDERTFQNLRLQAEEVGRIIGGLRVSVAQQRKNRSS